jgi:serine/threonine protein kinase
MPTPSSTSAGVQMGLWAYMTVLMWSFYDQIEDIAKGGMGWVCLQPCKDGCAQSHRVSYWENASTCPPSWLEKSLAGSTREPCTQVSRAKEAGMFGTGDVAIKTARTDGVDSSDNAALQRALESEARILDRLQATFCERVLRPVGLLYQDLDRYHGPTAHPHPSKLEGIVTEWCHGGSLFRWVPARSRPNPYTSRPRLPLRIRLEVARQLLEGLQHVHRCGIVHLDIKPLNVFLRGPPVELRDALPNYRMPLGNGKCKVLLSHTSAFAARTTAAPRRIVPQGFEPCVCRLTLCLETSA